MAALVVCAATADAQCPDAPSWAQGRAANCELIVDGGGAWGPIQFQRERAGFVGIGDNWKPICSGASSCEPCNAVVYSSTFDNYLGGGPNCVPASSCPATVGDDVIHLNTNGGVRHFLFKDSVVQRAFRLVAEDPSHADTIQIWSVPDYGGWLVFQDVTIRNSDTLTVTGGDWDYRAGRVQGGSVGRCDDPLSVGGIVFQGVTIDQDAAFRSDCFARGNSNCYGKPGLGSGNSNADGVNAPLPYLWVIESDFHTTMILGAGIQKLILIGQSPSGFIFTPGWNAWAAFGGSQVYSYSSIESALAAGHPAPPFLHLSGAGWYDFDADGVPAADDNCTLVANPPITQLAFQTTTGDQLDDDADGYGNQCDADFDQAKNQVDSADLDLFKVVFNRNRNASTCNPGGTSPCDRYDLDGINSKIDSGDLSVFKALFAQPKGPRCPACPLACSGDACP